MQGKYLITTDNWFIAPDGKQYRAAWGEVKIMAAKDLLGLEPNRNSANWMIRVGTDEHHIILAGCQIHYATSCPNEPHQGTTLQRFWEAAEPGIWDNPIYIPKAYEPEKKGDTVYGEWRKCDDNLIKIMESLDISYFDGESAAKYDVIKNIIKGNCEQYRYGRKPYERYKALEIDWITGTRETFRQGGNKMWDINKPIEEPIEHVKKTIERLTKLPYFSSCKNELDEVLLSYSRFVKERFYRFDTETDEHFLNIKWKDGENSTYILADFRQS